MHKLLWVLQIIQTTIKNRKVPHLKSTDLNLIEVTTLTCCNMQAEVKVSRNAVPVK